MSRNNQNNISRELIDEDNDEDELEFISRRMREMEEQSTPELSTAEEDLSPVSRRIIADTVNAQRETALREGIPDQLRQIGIDGGMFADYNTPYGNSSRRMNQRTPAEIPDFELPGTRTPSENSGTPEMKWSPANTPPAPASPNSPPWLRTRRMEDALIQSAPRPEPVLQVTEVNGTQVLMLDEFRNPAVNENERGRFPWRGMISPNETDVEYFNSLITQRRAADPRAREPGTENIPPEELVDLESKEEIPTEEEEEDDAILRGMYNEYENVSQRLQDVYRRIYDVEEQYRDNIYALRKTDIEYLKERIERIAQMIAEYQKEKRLLKQKRVERELQIRKNMR